MTQFLTTKKSDGHIWLCPLTIDHGVTELPEIIGRFSSDDGQIVEIKRVATGPASQLDDGDVAHYQRQIRSIVQNRFAATATNLGDFDEPVILAERAIHIAQTSKAVVRITLSSLSDHPDFVAHMSMLSSLYEFLGIHSDVEKLSEIASAMTVEEGMWLPVTDECENTSVMLVGPATGEPRCHHATFFGPGEEVATFLTRQKVCRITTWKKRGSAELHCAESAIGEIA
jgi:hypothetical protein